MHEHLVGHRHRNDRREGRSDPHGVPQGAAARARERRGRAGRRRRRGARAGGARRHGRTRRPRRRDRDLARGAARHRQGGRPPGSARRSRSREVLPFELESALPFDIEEAVFDYRVLPGLRETKGEELAVLVGVAKTADVARAHRAREDRARGGARARRHRRVPDREPPAVRARRSARASSRSSISAPCRATSSS